MLFENPAGKPPKGNILERSLKPLKGSEANN